MKIIRHVNPTDQIARAPYNFVPLPDNVITVALNDLPLQDRYDPDRLTGYIECSLTTESPVYVRCPFTLEEYQRAQQKALEDDIPWRERVKNNPDFFHSDPAKTPRIPGSSLRGMLRSLVEIVGYGKVEAVTANRLVYRSVGDTTSHGETYRNRIMHYDGQGRNREGKPCRQYTPLVQAGYLHQRAGEWWIHPAQKVNGTTYARIRIDDIPRKLERLSGCHNAERIYVHPSDFDYQGVRGGFLQVRSARVLRMSEQPDAGLIEGTLARSGEMASKRTEAVVFREDGETAPIQVPEEMILTYRDQISPEQEALLGKNGVLNEGQPVFYLLERGKLVFFGHTMMMRLPYPGAPLDFVPKALRDPAQVDLAEAIFGYTKKSGEGLARAYGGRVFMTDAVLVPGQTDFLLEHGKVITPKILGSPKPTTFQHYLVQAEPDRVEIGQTKDGRPKYEKRLADYAADSPGRTVIRGHKFYWHKDNVAAADIQEALDKLRDEHGKENEHDTQHTQMKPVCAGVHFKFRLYFENLSPVELGALMWTLTLPGEPSKQYRHSIGMGKPLGLGAINLEPHLFLTTREQRYVALFKESGWHEAIQPVPAEETVRFVQQFDAFVREQIGAKDLPALAAVERIRMLLQMLEWPGPRRELTRYLEIERPDPNLRRGKINEYKERPVLPDSLHIEAAGQRGVPLAAGGTRPPSGTWQPSRPVTPLPTSAQSPTRQPDRPSQGVSSTGRPTPAPAKQTAVLNHPASAAEVEPGMYLEGKVIRTEPARVVVDICGEEATLLHEAIAPPIRDDYDLRERFPKDKAVRVWVKNRNKAGRLQLTMLRA
jgi:CRISPR-associated protein (TIGR03986 family)